MTSTRSFLNHYIAAKKEMAPIGAISLFAAIFLLRKSSCTHNDWSIYFYHDAFPYRVAI